ncbi:Uncharacterised protein [Achromobacter denitrificans]|nr:Uncharacterised protein [Achromobacter denitrificans]
MVFHGLDFNGAQARRVGNRGARHAGEHHRADDVHLPQAAAHPAHQRHREVVDAAGDAGDVHQVARQDEKRHGQKRKRFNARDHALRHHHVGHAAGNQNEQQRRAHHGHRHRQAQDHQQQKRSNQNAHVLLPDRQCGVIRNCGAVNTFNPARRRPRGFPGWNSPAASCAPTLAATAGTSWQSPPGPPSTRKTCSRTAWSWARRPPARCSGT